jgi:hypothetical protein
LYGTTIFSENFDELTLAQTGLGLTSAGQFHTINGTNIDIVSAANGFSHLVIPPESGNVVDLGGTGGNFLGQLQSVAITLTPGTYTLSFDLLGSFTDQTGTATTVNLAPASGPALYQELFALTPNQFAIEHSVFTVTGSPETVYLTFSLLKGAPNIGSLLDNVSIDSGVITSPVPEPDSLLLVGSGLTALVVLVRRFHGNNRA